MTDAAVAEFSRPTPERLAQAGDLMEHPEVNQRIQRRAHRAISLVCGMHSRGAIDDQCLRAYERFETDWMVANRMPAITANYTDARGRSDQFEEQQEIRKSNAVRRVTAAANAIGSPHARRALEMLVSANPNTRMPWKLDDIGRACSDYGSRVCAITAGTVVIRDMLYQLRLHYEEG